MVNPMLSLFTISRVTLYNFCHGRLEAISVCKFADAKISDFITGRNTHKHFHGSLLNVSLSLFHDNLSYLVLRTIVTYITMTIILMLTHHFQCENIL